MTGAEELILKELAKVQDQLGDLREKVGALGEHTDSCDKMHAIVNERVTKLEGFGWKLLFAVVGSGAMGAGGASIAQALGL